MLKPEDFKVGLLITPDLNRSYWQRTYAFNYHNPTIGEVLRKGETKFLWRVWLPEHNMEWWAVIYNWNRYENKT